MTTTHGDLALQVDVAEWGWLRPHNERGALVLVAPGLQLAEVGDKMAADDSGAVQEWVAAGLLGKPSAEQVALWEEEPARSFSVLIISPFVLMQEKKS